MDLSPFGDLAGIIDRGNAIAIAQERYSSKREWAMALSGTTDTHSKYYKAALRRVERWTTGAQQKYKPSKASQQQNADLLSKDAKAIEQALEDDDIEAVDVDFAGEITVSEDTRYRKSIHFSMTRSEAGAVLAAMNAGKSKTASKEFWKAYGIAEPVIVSSDAELQIEARR